MRYLKKLLIAVYIYLGAYGLMAYIGWLIIRDEPTALTAAVFGAGGVEALIGGIIKLSEIRKNKNNADPPGGDDMRGT